jgi:hypothetical protein
MTWRRIDRLNPIPSTTEYLRAGLQSRRPSSAPFPTIRAKDKGQKHAIQNWNSGGHRRSRWYWNRGRSSTSERRLRLHLIDVDRGRLGDMQKSLPGSTTVAESSLSGPEECALALPGAPEKIDALIHLARIFVPHNLGQADRGIFDDTMQHNAINAYDLSGGRRGTHEQ